MIHSSIYIANTPEKGLGMFTAQALPAGLIIETALVLVMSADERKLLDQTRLHDYIFEWNKDGIPGCCMALGCVPIYNHFNPSNCEYYMNYEEDTILIKTVRKIEAGEELTINYNGDWNNEKSVWFEVKE